MSGGAGFLPSTVSLPPEAKKTAGYEPPGRGFHYLPNHHFSGSSRSSLGVYHPDSFLGTRLRNLEIENLCINVKACIS